MKTMVETLDLCSKWYPEKKLRHAIQVASYAFDMAVASKWIDPIDAYVVGLAHDLIEDTECPQEELQSIIGSERFNSVLDLTKTDDESYEKYIDRLLRSDNDLSILVKRADMKDHLMRTETLTDKLKDKYFPVIGKLL